MPIIKRFAALFLIGAAAYAAGQTPNSAAVTSLAQLLKEAADSNSQISAARHGWQAARQVARQVTTLPDPTFTYQGFSVGSPRPFAGYTNSDFAYVGVGASQELPYPGKLHLRGQLARQDAHLRRAQLDATRVTVADAVKSDYIQLAYVQKTLEILSENRRVMDQLIRDATAHYRVGQGAQEDVLQAQVERTQIVREITIRYQHAGQVEANLKGLLHRDQTSPDIVASDLVESPLVPTSSQLLQIVRSQNPQVQVDANAMNKQNAALASAKREGKPDFDLTYMYENTDRKYRDYYMFTLNVHLPRRRRVRAEVAENTEMLAKSENALDADLQQQMADVKQEYVTAAGDSDLLKEYRDGLIPQSDAAYRSTLSAYASGRGQFTNVLRSVLTVLNLRLDYAHVLAEHETALAHLESLTGATLR